VWVSSSQRGSGKEHSHEFCLGPKNRDRDDEGVEVGTVRVGVSSSPAD